MADARVPLIDMAVRLITQTALDAFTSRKKAIPRSLPPITPSTCKTCTIHTDVGMAYLYIKQMARLVPEDEPIPANMSGIVGLTHDYIGRASNEIPDLMLRDELFTQASELGRELIDIEKDLTTAKTGRDLRIILDKADSAVGKAYDIPTRNPIESLRDELAVLRKKVEDAQRPGDSSGENNSDRETA
jgi:polyhydroxyalkanoate synthesis regulator phasin